MIPFIPKQEKFAEMVLSDLLKAGWTKTTENGVLYVSPPQNATKEQLRGWISANRGETLSRYSEFIKEMEGKGIKSLVSDGGELASKLRKRGERAVSPYLELATADKDPHTGIRFSDIWKYFRLTWENPFEPSPGRSLLYLVRDSSHPKHAVMGIFALTNCPLRIKCRDDFLGWNASGEEKEEDILSYIEEGIEGIDRTGLPSDIEGLSFLAEEKDRERRESLLFGAREKDTKGLLYEKKRAKQLLLLLKAKEDPLNPSSVKVALNSQKAKHVGSSIMEVSTCGAIPPYNEILAGKLSALLSLSPQVREDYKSKYGNSPSVIASRMKGAPIVKPSDLVFLETTSLYYTGSSQYNRLKEWKKIGMTQGFGSVHISKETVAALLGIVNKDYRKVNYVYGEGSNPKMRLLEQGLRSVLDISSTDAKELTRHAMPKIVYGSCLAENTREYLLGKEDKPVYAETNTEEIIEGWRERWLKSRLNFEPIYQRLLNFDSTCVHHLTYQPNSQDI